MALSMVSVTAGASREKTKTEEEYEKRKKCVWSRDETVTVIVTEQSSNVLYSYFYEKRKIIKLVNAKTGRKRHRQLSKRIK
jgi:hypothetical protein